MTGARIGVLASGTGTNLGALLERVHGRDGIEVVAVGSDRGDPPAFEHARAAGVPTRGFPDWDDRAQRDAAMAAWLAGAGAEIVVLAGYMRLVEPAFLARFPRGVINVHPSLLPAFPGLDAIGQALDYGVKVTGVTVHYVDAGVDTGPIIAQRALELGDVRTVAALHDVLRPLEHDLLCAAVQAAAAGRIGRDPEHPRRVLVAAAPR